MSLQEIDELRERLIAIRLVDHAEFDECVRNANPDASLPELLRELERRQVITSYQSGLIARGEIDGLVLGGYKLMYRNASGSFARVFRACSVEDGSMVGLKLLRQRWAKDPVMVSQFRREAMMLKRFRHKNIVPIYDVGSQNDFHYFTMEFVEGGNLRDFINIRKRLSPLEASQCALDMSEGLEYALRMGATHRDLKLTNVLMSATGVAKLVDFGLAGNDSISGSSSGDDVQRALEYATLEKGTGAPRNDPRSDLFFLGAIFYELLTGVPPYPRTRDREERKQLSRYSHITPIQAVDPDLPDEVVEIVSKLMKLDPAERFQNPSEVVAALRAVIRNLDPNAESTPASAVQKSIMVVETREKQQSILREYLGKHGYRVLVSANVDRGINRLRTPNSPDCLLLMGDAIGSEDLPRAYQNALRVASASQRPIVALLSEKQAGLKSELTQSQYARVLVQPVTLRDLREVLIELIGEGQSDGAATASTPSARNR